MCLAPSCRRSLSGSWLPWRSSFATDALLTAARVYRLFWYTPLVRVALFVYFFCGIAMIASMR